MKTHKKFILALCVSLLSMSLAAQIPVSDIFDVVIKSIFIIRTLPATTITMNMTVPQAGKPVADVVSAPSYLQLTSIAPLNETRKVSTIISTGTKPRGTTLTLAVSPCTTGAGTLGNTYTVVLTTASSQTIIDGIGSCYTGTATADGYKMIYTWAADIPNYSLINATSGSNPITITHTISLASGDSPWIDPEGW